MDINFIDWSLWVPVVFGALFVYFYKHARPFLACLLLFAIGFATVSGIMPFYFQKFSNVADRYVYLSLFPAGLALAYAVYKLGQPAIIVATILLFFWASISFLQLRVWEKEFILWDTTINRYPDQALPYNNRGVVYFDQRHFESAIKDYNIAILNDSTYYSAYNNRGNALSMMRKFRESIADYDKAIQLKPTYGLAYFNRSQSYANLGQFQQAYDDLKRSIQLGYKPNPGYVQQLEAVMERGR